ncbi:MAG: sigma-70 family RNA polymerase sigma factor [Spirochaetaceae bacterium]|jgi:RNA polymerase sigma-70 factor (ECF subfamily)|nr:sigma-70 family RNA polymerase sigma factor [Spirochaetaceae bacterium]
MNKGDDFDDQMIVAEVVSGQKNLFRLLVNRHEKTVYAMGLSFFHNAEDASDFTQEVFLKLFRALAHFEGRSRFSTWLYKIAYNTAVNSVTRRKEYQSLAEEKDGPPARAEERAAPERAVLRDMVKEAVREAVRELPERYRVCVDLFFFYGRSYLEIEAITGYPVNTIKSHVFRAKKLLREKLKQLIEGGVE